MEDKPYYEQEYHEPKSNIPEPTFGQVFKLLFTAPFKWNARSTRKGFWISYAISAILSAILTGIIIAAIFVSGLSFALEDDIGKLTSGTVSTLAIIIVVAAFVVMIWVTLGQIGFTVRRLHDTDHSGWWYWIGFIPFGELVLLYFWILPTVERPVRWGGYLFTQKAKKQ